MSSTENNGNGHKIQARLANMRSELRVKYPNITADNLNCALDLASMILNSFTTETRNKLRQIQTKQENFIAGVKYGATVLVTLICAAGGLLLEKLIS